MTISIALKTSLALGVLVNSLALPAAAHGEIDFVINHYTQSEYNPLEPGNFTGRQVFYCDGHYQFIGSPGMVQETEDVSDC